MRKVRREQETFYGRLGRGASLAVFVAAGLLVAYKLLPVLKLVAVAMLVALVLRSITRGLERLRLPPWTTPFALLAVVGVFGVFVWLVIVPNLVQEARILISNFPKYVDSLTNLAHNVPYMPDLSRIGDRLKGTFSQLVGSFSSLAMKLLSLAGAVVAGLFLAVYMSVDPGPWSGAPCGWSLRRRGVRSIAFCEPSRSGSGVGSWARPSWRSSSASAEEWASGS
jgi:predicted PurR-regulated permease PerM